jgi:hypothetical protein
VFAVDVAGPGPAAGPGPFDLADVDARIGSYLGCGAADVGIIDMAVLSESHGALQTASHGGQRARAELVYHLVDVFTHRLAEEHAAVNNAPA